MMKPLRILLTAGVLAGAFTTGALAQMMGHAPPVPMSYQAFSKAAPGQNVQIAVQVQSVTRSTVSAEFLEHKTDAISTRTGKRVKLFLPRDVPVIMGASSDIAPGAVLFVYGIVTRSGSAVDAKRVVVDTKYVTVQ